MKLLNNIINPIWVISLPLFGSIGYVGARLFETTILFWQITFIASLLCVAGSVFYFRFAIIPEKVQTSSIFSHFIGILPLLLFASGLWAVWNSVDLQVSNNGDLHTAYTAQILYGEGVPENTFIPGYPANYYWLYHALLAVLTSFLNVPIPMVSALLNAIVLFTTIGWAIHTIHLLLDSPPSPIVVMIFAIFLVFGLNIFGFIISIQHIQSTNFEFTDLAPVTPYGPQLVRSLVYKFYNFTSFSHSVMYQWVAIYGVLSILKRGWSNTGVLFTVVGISGMIMFQIIGALFFVGLTMFLGVVSSDIFLIAISNYKQLTSGFVQHYRGLFRAVLDWFLAKNSRLIIFYSIITAVPMIFYILEFLSNYNPDSNDNVFIFFKQLNPLLYMFGLFYPLLPFAAIGLVIGIIRKDRMLISLSLLGVSAMFVYYSTNWLTNQSYKFLLLMPPFLTINTMLVLDQFSLRVTDNKHVSSLTVVTPFLLFALMFHILPLNAEYQVKANNEHEYAYDGIYVDMSNAPYNTAWQWIRENTSYDTIVLMPHEESRFATLVNQRLSYAMDFTFQLVNGIPEYAQRVEAMQLFMKSETVDATEYQEALGFIHTTLGDRPAVIIIPFDSSFTKESANGLGLEWLHSTDNANIYQILD